MNENNKLNRLGLSKFLSALEGVQKYAAPLILVPLVIGGLWQLLALASIGLSFIRFFSVSQMIPDGLVVVFMFSLIYLTIYISFPTLSKNIQSIREGGILLNVIQFIVLSVPAFLLADIFIYEPSQLSSAIFWVIAPLLLLISTFSLLAFVFSIIKIFNKVVTINFGDTSNEIINLVSGIVLFYIFAALLVTTTFIALQFHKFFAIGSNLSNVNNICPSSTAKCNIIYFNDKYIFVEKLKDKKPYIEVKQFDAFFTTN